MSKDAPDRITISLPSDAEVDRQRIRELVEKSEAESISEYIRWLVAESDE